MIEETISKLEARLQNSASLSEQNREELLSLLATLKGEVSLLSKTHADDARKIVGYTEASTDEATGQEGRSEQLTAQLQELSRSVDKFEESHPQLVQVVNRLAQTLSNLGI